MLIEVLPMVHHVLVMSVNPGFGGQKFLPRSVDRIAHLARLRAEMGLNFRIEVDGGIAHDTVASRRPSRSGHARRRLGHLRTRQRPKPTPGEFLALATRRAPADTVA